MHASIQTFSASAPLSQVEQSCFATEVHDVASSFVDASGVSIMRISCYMKTILATQALRIHIDALDAQTL